MVALSCPVNVPLPLARNASLFADLVHHRCQAQGELPIRGEEGALAADAGINMDDWFERSEQDDRPLETIS